MPSFGDTALIALLALLLFGPKKLPELARQLGKLMGEFRRASNEFRMQMEDELRISEQEERQKKIAAMEAAAPVTPPLLQDESIVIDHPHQPAENYVAPENSIAAPVETVSEHTTDAAAEAAKPDRHTEPLPIASAGELEMMPPATGLPTSRSPLSSVLDSIPHTQDPETAAQPLAEQNSHEASLHG
ncbi:Sec-independent protein translocase subunit TatA/TatB [Granulicella arctica]|uniref:Sec-independent protein translocase subunit TatA/TatB n=1 Tax=Granulicella arctica TaxID=940613 RepID=UPI0021DFBA1B|nr:twin-arginine translocase TatA/TatE family subunit [Granulicella arctica]